MTQVSTKTPVLKHITFGLTGGIGSGKSFIAKILEEKGIPIYNTDKEAKRLMAEDQTIRGQLIEHFGPEVYAQNKLNKAFLSQVVFNDSKALETLNSIVHPVVIKDLKLWFKHQSALLSGVESALLFSTPIPSFVNFTIGVMASEETRLKRAVTRDHVEEKDIRTRMSAQLSPEALKKRCDYLISNDTKDDINEEIKKLIAFLTSLLT